MTDISSSLFFGWLSGGSSLTLRPGYVAARLLTKCPTPCVWSHRSLVRSHHMCMLPYIMLEHKESLTNFVVVFLSCQNFSCLKMTIISYMIQDTAPLTFCIDDTMLYRWNIHVFILLTRYITMIVYLYYVSCLSTPLINVWHDPYSWLCILLGQLWRCHAHIK